MKMTTNDVIERKDQMQENFTSYMTTHEPNGVKTMGELVNDIHSSVLFKLFCASFIIHILVLVYYLRFKWNYRSWWELKFYLPRIRKYVGLLLAVFSFLISFITMINMGASEETQHSVICLIVFSGFLTLFAVFLAYGFKGKPSPYVSLHAIFLTVMICTAPGAFAEDSNQLLLAETVFGLLHISIGVLLIFMRCRDDNVPGQPWNLRNGNANEL